MLAEQLGAGITTPSMLERPLQLAEQKKRDAVECIKLGVLGNFHGGHEAAPGHTANLQVGFDLP